MTTIWAAYWACAPNSGVCSPTSLLFSTETPRCRIYSHVFISCCTECLRSSTSPHIHDHRKFSRNLLTTMDLYEPQQPPTKENCEKISQCRSESCAIGTIFLNGVVTDSPVLLFGQLLRQSQWAMGWQKVNNAETHPAAINAVHQLQLCSAQWPL